MKCKLEKLEGPFLRRKFDDLSFMHEIRNERFRDFGYFFPALS